MSCVFGVLNMRCIRGRSLPALYSLRIGLQVGLSLDLFGYMVSIYKEYDIIISEQIFLHRQDVF